MTYDTINDAVTIADNGEGTLLAGRYSIVRQLGQGGMGSVWLAEDTQLDNKPFAIKMLPSILVANKRAYRQLKDEALVAMRLVHPNIVQIRAFEENNGNPFLVMDYIDGQTLDDYLAEHFPAAATPADVARPPRPCCKGEGALATSPGTGVSPVAGADALVAATQETGLPESDVLRILRPIAAALDYAHAKGVVHRDVKPGNVMIAKDGTPYILDFGIAREIQETLTRVTGKSSSGTLLYMSPEQLNGAQPKPAQDVYSFAAMVYECLKGEPPFVCGAIEDQIKNKQPEPPPGGTQLVASVMSGLAKKPDDRPSTCSAVLEGNGLSRVERLEGKDINHVERVDDAGGSRSRATAKILLSVAALALAIAGGWWYVNTRVALHWGNGALAASSNTGDTKTITLPGGATMEMIYVAPGTFTMGSPTSEEGRDDDEMQHRVSLTKGYWLGKYEVTQAQWESVMGENPSKFKDGDRPVENVAWEDCQRFISKINSQQHYGARLPTEAEWEFACRAGSTGQYGGNGNLDDMGWYYGNSGRETHIVGQKQANAWGFYDMHGNVWEWCEGKYASGGGRVLRGGGWSNNARNCRSANRVWNYPDFHNFRNYNSGFRLACSAGPRK